MTLHLLAFTVLNQCYFAQALPLWLPEFGSFEVSCLATPPHEPSFPVSPTFPSVQFGSTNLASKAIWELCQILALMTFAVSPLPSRNELIMWVPTPSSFKYNLQRESELGCNLDFFLMNMTSDLFYAHVKKYQSLFV